MLRKTLCWPIVVLLLTGLIYLPGLKGPFLFDDPPNIIMPISAWLDGQTGWQEIVFGNHSGLLGRPLSMLSFALNAAIGGLDPLHFKATNLAIHLACAFLIYVLARSLLKRDRNLTTRRKALALLIMAIWALHPLQVSTVLYAVQRMAQLSTFFILASLLAYIAGRAALEHASSRRAKMLLFLAFPLATGLAMASKENGALAPLLCAVIELVYFRPKHGTRRPGEVRAFFTAFLMLPATLVIGWYAMKWPSILAGYAGRDFTVTERLLTQPRVLFDYLGSMLAPQIGKLGVYTDDFQVSHGLLDPPTTAVALLGLLGLVTAAWTTRRILPSVSFGILFFFAAHAMESTIFPLEMHFEHRNYLPSVGIFYALVSGLTLLFTRMPHSDEAAHPNKLAAFAAVAIIATLALSTWIKVDAWKNWPTLAAEGVKYHPESMRAHLDHASMLMASGRFDDAQQVFDQMKQMRSRMARHSGHINTLFIQCHTRHEANPTDLAAVANIAGQNIRLTELLAFEMLGNTIKSEACENLPATDLADIIVNIINNSDQPEATTPAWRARFLAAQLYAHDGHVQHAITQAATSYMSGHADPAVGGYLTMLYIHANELSHARVIYADVQKRVRPWDRRNLLLLEHISNALATH